MRLGAYSKYYSRWTIIQWLMICISAHADSNISIHSEMNSDGYFMERNRTLGNTEQLWSAWSVSSTNYVYAICWYPHYRIRTRNSRMQAYAHSFLPFPAARLLATRVPAYKVGWAVSRDGMDSMYRLGTTVRMYKANCSVYSLDFYAGGYIHWVQWSSLWRAWLWLVLGDIKIIQLRCTVLTQTIIIMIIILTGGCGFWNQLPNWFLCN